MNAKLIGEIRADCVYTVREFCKRTGIGSRHVHEHFVARRMAGRRYILGQDFIDALKDETRVAPFSGESLNRPHLLDGVVDGVREQLAESS
jgi:hypothetical protein